MPPFQTFSGSHIRRQREAHAKTDGYGRHRHLYLHDTLRRLAQQLNARSWLDYGCGKGGFIEQIHPLDLFASIAGYDPAVEAFAARPEGRFDVVTCLDVIDIVEPRFLAALLDDVAAYTDGLAVFDVLTKPNRLRPHAPFHWTGLVRQHMDVVESRVEFPRMQDLERVVIIAAPRGRHGRAAD